MYAAGLQLFHVFGIEDKIKGANRCVVAQYFAHFANIDAQASGAPHVVNGIGVARVISLCAIFDHVPEVAGIGQLCQIQRLKYAGSYLALKKGAGRDNNVVSGAASQQFCFKKFIGIKDIIDQFDPGLRLKFFQKFIVNVI